MRFGRGQHYRLAGDLYSQHAGAPRRTTWCTHGLWQRDLDLGDRSGDGRAVAAQQGHSPAVADGYAALPVEFATPAKSVNRWGGWPRMANMGWMAPALMVGPVCVTVATVSGATLAS